VPDDKYEQVEISKDPSEYLTGPTGNVANRGTGGTTRDGQVQVLRTDEEVRTTQTQMSNPVEESTSAPTPTSGGQTDQSPSAAGAQGGSGPT
jgi:hypothetical protein